MKLGKTNTSVDIYLLISQLFALMESTVEQSVKKVPVLLLAFNRPQATAQVLTGITPYGPPDLYVAVDGPRTGRKDDEQHNAEIGRIVAQWEAANPATRVHRLFRDTNLGCGRGVSSAITWFFDAEPMGIILEDDCLPNKSFFHFCEEMLHRYATEERIMHVSGCNHLHGGVRMDSTYYFSNLPQIWGWATWRRAWNKYSFEMTDLEGLFRIPAFQRYYKEDPFRTTAAGKLDTWDTQWVYAFLMNNGLSVLTKYNFVKNIGFDTHGGVHYEEKPPWYNDTVTENEVLIPPGSIEANVAADDYVFRKIYNPSIVLRAKRKLRKLLFK